MDPTTLEPVLTEDDDLRGMRQPWNPSEIVLVSFFGGPLASAGLFAWNAARLGRPKQIPWILVIFGLLTAVQIGEITIGFMPVAAEDGGASEDEVTVGALAHLFSLIPAAAIARRQRRRFRLFELSGGEPDSVVVIGGLAMYASWVVVLSISVFLSVVAA